MNRSFTIIFFMLAVTASGCYSPMSPYPPNWPAGGYPGNRTTPIPVQQQAPPQTFAPPNPTVPRSLDDVASVAAKEALKLPPQPKDLQWHDVRPGDTLSSIARQHSVTVDVLMEANGFGASPDLVVGQYIRIP
jgi:LysM repeat protein